MTQSFLVFSTERYRYFKDQLCQHEAFHPGSLEKELFPDGEAYHRISCSVRDKEVIVIGGSIDDRETLELYDISFGVVRQGARTLSMVVPYFGYSTMERTLKPGEIVKAKNRAVLLSSIPKARIWNEIVLMDLHTGGLPHYFEGPLLPCHLSARRVIFKIIRSLGALDHIVLASTDAGRAKWVVSLANELGVPAAFVYKQRKSGVDTEVSGINADVKGKHVVIYDDMIRTGGSLVKAGEAYKKAGAKQLTAIATHGVLPGDALKRIYQSAVFEKVFVTDTHPNAVRLAREFKNPFFEIHSVTDDVTGYLLRREEPCFEQ